MATSKSHKSKPVVIPADDFSSPSIEEQTARFLSSGGKVQQIALGVSGQVATTGPRHITLGKRHLQAQ
ncbi:MAG: hypothetical protein ACKVOF_07215 [Pseudohongiellaceae bacterium]|jgi:hypothetical protein